MVVFGSGHFTIKIFGRLIDRIPNLVETSFLPLFLFAKCSYHPPDLIPTSSFSWILADLSTKLSTYVEREEECGFELGATDFNPS